MGKRATGRKLAMQMLYQSDIRQVAVSSFLKAYLDNTPYAESTKEWASELALKAYEFHAEADLLIQKYAIDWDLDRLTPVDKSILRIAIYELKHTDTPISIVLNEAIEISKRYSTDESPKFINGILGTFVKEECSQA